MAKKSTISALTTVAYSIVFVILAISAIVLVQIAAFGVGQRDQSITGLQVFSSGVDGNVLDVNQYEDQIVNEITMQIKGTALLDEGESGYVDYSSLRIKISVRTAQNEIWTNSNTRPADIKIGDAEMGSVSGEVGINENFTLVLRTKQENNAEGIATDYLIGGTCYIYAYTTDGLYASEPLAVNIDVPVEFISMVVFDYKSDNVTAAVSDEENPQMFIQGDQLQFGITAIPSNSLNPIAGRPSKLANFRFTDGTNHTKATLTEQGLFTVVGDTVSTTGSHEIKARIAKHFGVSGEGEKNFVESETIIIHTAPVELESIFMGNATVSNNGISIYVGEEDKIKLGALNSASGVTYALQLSLRSKHYTNGVDPLAGSTDQLQLEIVDSFTGGTDPRGNFADYYEKAVGSVNRTVIDSNVIWELEAYRPLVTGEKLQLRIKYPSSYEKPDTYTIEDGKVTINGVEYTLDGNTLKADGVEPDFNGNGWGNGYTVSGNTVTVETGCVYIDLYVKTVNLTGFAYSSTETSMEITKQTNEAGKETILDGDELSLENFVTCTNAPAYSKWVYFKEDTSNNKNAAGSDIIDLSAAGQVRIDNGGGIYSYSSKIVAKGGGEVGIRAYLVRTDADGNPLNCNYQPLEVDSETGWVLESEISYAESDENKFVVLFEASLHTITITEKLTKIEFFEDEAMTSLMSSENAYVIGTGVSNSKTIYARANSTFALWAYYFQETGSHLLEVEVLDTDTEEDLSYYCQINKKIREEPSIFYYLELKIIAYSDAVFEIRFKQEGKSKGEIFFEARNIEVTAVDVDFSDLDFGPTGGTHILDSNNSVTINGKKYVYDEDAGVVYNASVEADFNGTGYTVNMLGTEVTVGVGEDAVTHTIANNVVNIGGVNYSYNPINKKLFTNGKEADFNGTGYTIEESGEGLNVVIGPNSFPINNNEVNIHISGDDGDITVRYIYSPTDNKIYLPADFNGDADGNGYEPTTEGEGESKVTKLIINDGVKTLSIYRANPGNGVKDYADSDYNILWKLPVNVIYHISEEDQAEGFNPSAPSVDKAIYLVDRGALAGYVSSEPNFSSFDSGDAYVTIATINNEDVLTFKPALEELPADKALIIVYSAGTRDGTVARSDWFVLDIHLAQS